MEILKKRKSYHKPFLWLSFPKEEILMVNSTNSRLTFRINVTINVEDFTSIIDEFHCI